MFDCSLRSLPIALWSPATSSSLVDEEHVRSLLLSTPVRDRGFDCSLRSLPIALWSPATSSSLVDEEHVRSLLLSTPVRDRGFDCSLRSRFGVRLLRRRSWTKSLSARSSSARRCAIGA